MNLLYCTKCWQRLNSYQHLSSKPILKYPISKIGNSSLRSLLEHDTKHEFESSKVTNIVDKLLSNYIDDPVIKNHSKATKALMLLCHGYGDGTHEVVLGVNPTNLDEAEYAATHPGQTNFAQKYPLTDCDDIVHSIIHRYCEGHTVGEGGYTGYENAKYWIAGGPKKYYSKAAADDDDDDDFNIISKHHQLQSKTTHQHPIYDKLALFAVKNCPLCVSAGLVLVAGTNDLNMQTSVVTHSIIAGGGQCRTVVVGPPTVSKCVWDPSRFIDLFQSVTMSVPNSAHCQDHRDDNKNELSLLQSSLNQENLANELILLQKMEITLLIHYELCSQLGTSHYSNLS